MKHLLVIQISQYNLLLKTVDNCYGTSEFHLHKIIHILNVFTSNVKNCLEKEGILIKVGKISTLKL